MSSPAPNGECEGLYVTHKSGQGFEVHELHGGTRILPSTTASWRDAGDSRTFACKTSPPTSDA
ncbi:hypothetical protein SBA7_950035 [Candidatus Sulfotelmatobacter sp. SbA7]|nr:hypothetical protein SBA7_950035 [Candidatus Sulfotelmatobacter sp. SbA7]